MTGVLTGTGERTERPAQGRGLVQTEAGTGTTQLQGWECQEPPEARKSQGFHSRAFRENIALLKP